MPKANALVSQPECATFIIVAATELLAEVGYGAMSMRQLASRAGLLPGSLYHHVASKQDLLLCVIIDLLDARDNAWQALPRRRGVQAELQSFIRFVLAWQAAHPLQAQVLEHEQRHLEAHLKAWLAQRANHLPLQLQTLLRKGQKQGVFGDIDVEASALAVMALLGTADALCSSSQRWTLAHLETHFLRMTLRVLEVDAFARPAPIKQSAQTDTAPDQ